MKLRSLIKKTPIEALPTAALLRLIGCLALVLGPHLLRVPPWAAALSAGVLVWRYAAAIRQWRTFLPAWLRVALSLSAFTGIYENFGRISGQTAGVALITVMAALKLTELRGRRDTVVMAFLMYFILITHFLYSQELWTAAYLIVCAIAITAVLIEAHHPGGRLGAVPLYRLSSLLVAQALPLMVVIFVLFPRIPGPLWGLPSDSGAARSGLSDSMAPGDISSLIQSNELAFRVRFKGEAPNQHDLYWRGPSFSHFDGHTWDAGVRVPPAVPPDAELEGDSVNYEIVMEANRAHWLLALDLPEPGSLPEGAALNADYQLILLKDDVRERRLYRLRSHTHYRLQPELPPALRETMLRIPKNSNPKTQALAAQWRGEGLTSAQIVERALTMFRKERFFYTLQPPALGRHSVDEFLFVTHRGFCEHYASSFAFLMRAAGIPARIVTGYQGGERSAVGDYYLVRQSDAHAWAEVWLEGRGWARIDPTAAVAPDRIERGLGQALAGTEALPGFLDPSNRRGFRFNLAARWDWLNAQWNYWVLGYGPDLQQAVLRQLGLFSWRDMILALTALMTVLLTGFGFWLLRKNRVDGPTDPLHRIWRRMQAKLVGLGVEMRDHEGPRDYIARAASVRPDLAPALHAALQIYLRQRYYQLPNTDSSAQLASAVSRIGI